ncbi:MAG TPA: NAD(P) transhydrogenase subunit alpha [Thermoplasmata archaeon]|nr:NAD(P) transhydrogenase subunit alpha [Thermoplasmata archaeon]
MAVCVVAPKEVAPGEKRVALVPEVAGRLVKSGHRVCVEAGAGEDAGVTDPEYTSVGAQIVGTAQELYGSADIVLKVQPPTAAESESMREGTVVIALMNASRNLDRVAAMRDRKLTGFALELVPRITRAQSMDALSSQATAAGYKAVLLGAELSPRFFPMLTTAAGTIRPAKVLVLGAGVAGLMAIATARRLGGMVEAYDVRRAAGEQVRSLGAKFLELQINAEGAGGYARELTPEEKLLESTMVSDAVTKADVVITTAAIPGRKAPVLVTKETVGRMKPGSVLVDLAAETGGNCEATKPGKTVRIGEVTIVGPLNLPSETAYHSSQMYSKNLQAFLGLLLTPEGALVTDYSDEILAASLLVAGGTVRHRPTADLLAGAK